MNLSHHGPRSERSGATQVDGKASRLFTRRNVIAFLIAFLVVSYLAQVYQYKSAVQIDPLFTSGCITFVIAIIMASSVEARWQSMLESLHHRDILDKPQVDMVARQYHDGTGRASLIGAIVVALLMMITYSMSGRNHKGVLLAMVVAGSVAGAIIGRMVLYGAFGYYIQHPRSTKNGSGSGPPLRLIPDHPDGLAGTRPIGEFYSFQARLLAIPAIFLAVWWYIIPLQDKVSYTNWREPYIFLFAITIGLEICSFVFPLLSVHNIMCQFKNLRSMKWDEQQGIVIGRYRDQLDKWDNSSAREQMAAEMESIAKIYKEIRNLPTWPVEVRVWRTFAIRNVALLLTLIGQLTMETIPWDKVGSTIRDLG